MSPDPELRVLGATQLSDHAILIGAVVDTAAPDVIRGRALAALPHTRLEMEPIIALIRGAGPELRRTVATRLAQLEANEKNESTLIELLNDETLEVRISAATALSRIGTLRAVEPLSIDGFFTSSKLLTAAQLAVPSIQRRHGGGSGQLSITSDADQGRLSTTTTDGGHLSKPDDE